MITRRSPAFSILELVVALTILASSAFILAAASAETGDQDADRATRVAASRIARNVTAQLLDDPWDSPATNRNGTTASTRVNATGESDPDGDFAVATTRTIQCDGGTRLSDNTTAPAPAGGCTATRATVTYAVTVSYPARGANNDGQIALVSRIGETGTWHPNNSPAQP